jgi:tripartite-type tricarboxylate transporter receptor subunit TctC
MGVWVGLFAPAGTPRPVVERLDAATRGALASPELRARFAELGLEPFPAGPEELGAYLAAEIEKWVRVVRGADIRLD